ncbi:hypothetical protein SIO70_01070 [Chitinophaga sancti]|uniref:hypothetical protein n=1 Tax=Chitinophaga sancti TaxID=1004 RepID=UPI002A756207|nr:hypothetical protein [Chitinophaga sancti]WPQ63454.1 hypothetical protein SIO70_01070 [Chitinophaga sancti]
MKRTLLAGVAGLAALTLFSCTKEKASLRPDSELAVAAAAGSDEMDAILKDLSPETYLLTFDGLPGNNYITKATYGGLSDETQFGVGGIPIPYLERIGYTKAPFKKIWIKTCPTMIPYLDIAKRAAALIQKVDSKTFADLTITELSTKQQVLATKTFLTAAGRLQPDVVDTKVLAKSPLEQFRLSIPQGTALPYFTRGFYGLGDITQVPGAGSKLTIYTSLRWEDILRRKFPNMIGCFDPQVLKDIRANFVLLDRGFEKLNVEEVAGGAILGIN